MSLITWTYQIMPTHESNDELMRIYREIIEETASDDPNVFTIDSLPYQEQHVMNRNWKQQGF